MTLAKLVSVNISALLFLISLRAPLSFLPIHHHYTRVGELTYT